MAAIGLKLKLVLFVGVLAASIGTAAWLDAKGYARATLEWQVKWAERERELDLRRFRELERQALANDAAKAQEAAQLELYRRRISELEQLAIELEEEARTDAGADRLALDAGAVARYNRRIGW